MTQFKLSSKQLANNYNRNICPVLWTWTWTWYGTWSSCDPFRGLLGIQHNSSQKVSMPAKGGTSTYSCMALLGSCSLSTRVPPIARGLPVVFGPCWTLVIGASPNPLYYRGCNSAYSEQILKVIFFLEG